MGPDDAAFWQIVGDLEPEQEEPVADDTKRSLPDEVEWGTPKSDYPDGNYGNDFPMESGDF